MTQHPHLAALSRRRLLQALGGAGVAAAACRATPAARGLGGSSGGSRSDAVVTFVSLPDFFNGDVADLSVLPSWDGGRNSVNESWTAAIDRCLGAVVEHRPDAVLLAGDMVEGRWNIDSDDRRLFGAVSQGIDPESLARCRSAVTTAGGVYYPYAGGLFAQRGLALYPAIGDHELLDDREGPLDDRWSPSGFQGRSPDNRYHLVDHCKSVWADHFTHVDGAPRFSRRPHGSASELTAYATSFADSLTLITVDTFTRRPEGVRLGVHDAQLAWVAREVRRAKRRGHAVVVQGHIPIMSPTRWLASGRMHVPQGHRSELYRVLDREGADLYLCGEVHDSTAIQHATRAPVQISHGCIFRYGFTYLVGRLYPDRRLVLDLYEIPLLRASRDRDLWSSDARKRQRGYLDYGSPVHRGRLVQRDREVLARTAKLGAYDEAHDPYSLRLHRRTELV